MYGVTKENEIKFMRHIVETGGNPTSKVAKECGLEGFFCELCCRHVPKAKMVEIATKYLEGGGKI